MIIIMIIRLLTPSEIRSLITSHFTVDLVSTSTANYSILFCNSHTTGIRTLTRRLEICYFVAVSEPHSFLLVSFCQSISRGFINDELKRRLLYV